MNRKTGNHDTAQAQLRMAQNPAIRPWTLAAFILGIGFGLPAAALAQDGTVPATPRLFPTAKEEKKEEGKAMEAAAKLILPSVHFEEVTLEDAVKFLNETAKKTAAGKPVPQLKVGPDVDGKTLIKQLVLKNVPLREAAMYCANETKTLISADDKTLTFVKP
ncbi:hypothetical protein [Luteolibacter sp. Populi]|uniref:hypothetical protein n=1 Tax=Luteolibacter sp. Populi TaxID=3230487 RepID=UPI0034652DB7